MSFQTGTICRIERSTEEYIVNQKYEIKITESDVPAFKAKSKKPNDNS
jgi:hypothetical protein